MKVVKRKDPRYYLDPKDSPVTRIEPGDEVFVDLFDTYTGQIKTEQDLRPNIDRTALTPLIGPIFIKGVEPGDTLTVLIKDITLDDSGIMPLSPGLGVLGRQVEETNTRIFNVNEEYIDFNKKLQIQKSPMIGTIGVAPKGDKVRAFTPGDFGGNMDLKEIRIGSTIHFPVFVPGALLYLGDLHGIQGDGELCGTGLEIAGSVTMVVDVKKGEPINRPRVITDEKLMFISSQRTIDRAIEEAVSDSVDYLAEYFDFSFSDTYRLVSLLGDIRICQVVNPTVTVRLEFPRQYL